GTVSITTFVEDEVTYSTAIPFGGGNITRDLAAGLRLSLEDAEKVKTHAEELFKNSENVSKKSEKKGEDEEGTKSKKTDILDVSVLGIEGVKTISRKLFNEIIEARVAEIFDLVIENIEASGNEYQLPAGIVITGGTAQLPG